MNPQDPTKSQLGRLTLFKATLKSLDAQDPQNINLTLKDIAFEDSDASILSTETFTSLKAENFHPSPTSFGTEDKITLDAILIDYTPTYKFTDHTRTLTSLGLALLATTKFTHSNP